MEKRFFVTPIQVKYRDTDSMGHVSSPVYYDYIQHAYLDYMFNVLGVPKTEKLPQIMVKTACEYIQPAVYGDQITVKSSLTSFGTKSFEIEYIMLRDDSDETVIARGYSKHVMYDYTANKTVAVNDSFKSKILEFQGQL